MPGRVIAVDFDDTLVHTFMAMDAWMASSGYPAVDWSHHVPFAKEILDGYHGFETPETALLVQGAVPACAGLSRTDRLFIVTFRCDRHLAGTRRLVDALFPDLFEDIICTGHLGSKLATLQHLGADLLVDDSPKHVGEAEAHGIPAILFGMTPWNAAVGHVRRARDWADAETIIACMAPAPPGTRPGG